LCPLGYCVIKMIPPPQTEEFVVGYIVGIITAACTAALICELLGRWYAHIIIKNKDEDEEES